MLGRTRPSFSLGLASSCVFCPMLHVLQGLPILGHRKMNYSWPCVSTRVCAPTPFREVFPGVEYFPQIHAGKCSGKDWKTVSLVSSVQLCPLHATLSPSVACPANSRCLGLPEFSTFFSTYGDCWALLWFPLPALHPVSFPGRKQ